MFTFDVASYLQSGEPLRMGELTIPRYGSLTVEEAILLEGLQVDVQSDALNNLELLIALATVLMQCRFDPGWTALNTMQLPIDRIEAAAEFLLNEQRRWKTVEPTEEAAAPPKKSIGTT